MKPVIVQVFCYSCRSETNHRLAQFPLYRCEKNCGSPWRHISDPDSKTPEAIRNAKEAEAGLKEYWKKENTATEFFSAKALKAAKKRYGHK